MFGEQTKEWSPKDGMELQVVLSPKYIQTRANAMEIIQKHTYLSEEDFWILKHVTRAKKMQYDGLIISSADWGCSIWQQTVPLSLIPV